jgi:tetratricopeptide (TPR) repeat protein
LTSSGIPPGARRPSRKAVVPVYMAIGVLALVAVGVVLLLPEWVNSPSEQTVKEPTPVAKLPLTIAVPAARDTAPAKNPAETLARQEAQRLLAEALKRQAQLENDGIGVWGDPSLPPSYADVLTVFNKANTLLDRQEFAEASVGFRKTIRLFDKLMASKNERFARAMNAGMAVLGLLEGAAAASQFQIALALRPGDDVAQNGLRRAALASQVKERMDEAWQLEAAGDIEAAFKVFRAAAELDGDYIPARENANRLGVIIRDRDYRKAISGSLSAIERKNFSQATKYLEFARKIRPTAPEIVDIRKNIRSGRQLKAIASLRNRARASEQAERWREVIGFYDKILKIDATAGFAVAGRARAVRIESIYNQVRNYLDNPGRLSSAEPMAQARQVLAAANGVGGGWPRLRADVERLGVLISAANTPRVVVLKSDGQTNVVLYRVARFGSLSERRLTLKPGHYVAVGSRSGYRDVRVEFRVLSRDAETIVVVRCTERI